MIHKYRVKILENINLEGDESFLCKDYSYPGEYDQCLQAEYIRERGGEIIDKLQLDQELMVLALYNNHTSDLTFF